MDDHFNEKDIDLDSIYSYENSVIIISIIFAILDLLSIIIFSLILKPENRDINILKQILIKLFILDIIVRIIYTKKYSSWTIFKEIFLNIMTCIQFYLFISFLSLTLYKSKQLKRKGKIIQLCILFFLVNFSFEKIIYIFKYSNNISFIINKFIILLQSFSILYFVYKLYKDIQKSVESIRNKILDNNKKKSKVYLLILGSPQSGFILYFIYYSLKIISTFINNPIFIIYANIGLNILRESSKYFIFFVCQAIIIYLNHIKYKREKDNKSSNEENEELKNFANWN